MVSTQKSPKGSLFIDSVISSHLEKLDYPEKSIWSMKNCGLNIGSQHIIKKCGCGINLIPLNHHCSLRTCPDCSKLRKRRIRDKFLPFMKSLPRNRLHDIYFLTISPKNYANLEKGMEHLRKSFSKFVRLKYINERILGGLAVIETKQTDEKGWNLHLHAIIYSRRLDMKIRREFEDSKIVSLWKKSSKRDVYMRINKLNTLDYTLNYVLKYVSANKDDFSSPKNFARYIVATRKRKLLIRFGMFFKFKPVKKPHVCSCCMQIIEFIYDLEIVGMMKEAEAREKERPPDLGDY